MRSQPEDQPRNPDHYVRTPLINGTVALVSSEAGAAVGSVDPRIPSRVASQSQQSSIQPASRLHTRPVALAKDQRKELVHSGTVDHSDVACRESSLWISD